MPAQTPEQISLTLLLSARVIIPPSARIECATKEPELLGITRLQRRLNVPVSQHLWSSPSRTYRERIHRCVHFCVRWCIHSRVHGSNEEDSDK